jgi:hypothetical protein
MHFLRFSAARKKDAYYALQSPAKFSSRAAKSSANVGLFNTLEQPIAPSPSAHRRTHALGLFEQTEGKFSLLNSGAERRVPGDAAERRG